MTLQPFAIGTSCTRRKTYASILGEPLQHQSEVFAAGSKRRLLRHFTKVVKNMPLVVNFRNPSPFRHELPVNVKLSKTDPPRGLRRLNQRQPPRSHSLDKLNTKIAS